jgi:hypothetical protein
MKTFTVEVTQVVQAKAVLERALVGSPKYLRARVNTAISMLGAYQAPDDLAAAAQLEHSGLISREKYNHIVENIRARERMREAMA